MPGWQELIEQWNSSSGSPSICQYLHSYKQYTCLHLVDKVNGYSSARLTQAQRDEREVRWSHNACVTVEGDDEGTTGVHRKSWMVGQPSRREGAQLSQRVPYMSTNHHKTQQEASGASRALAMRLKTQMGKNQKQQKDLKRIQMRIKRQNIAAMEMPLASSCQSYQVNCNVLPLKLEQSGRELRSSLQQLPTVQLVLPQGGLVIGREEHLRVDQASYHQLNTCIDTSTNSSAHSNDFASIFQLLQSQQENFMKQFQQVTSQIKDMQHSISTLHGSVNMIIQSQNSVQSQMQVYGREQFQQDSNIDTSTMYQSQSTIGKQSQAQTFVQQTQYFDSQDYRLVQQLKSRYGSLPQDLQLKIDLESLINQIKMMRSVELESLWEQRENIKFWEYFSKYKYVHLAIHMSVLTTGQQKLRTIQNNELVVRRFSQLAQSKNITVLTPATFNLYHKLFKHLDIKKVSTMKQQLKTLRQILKFVFKSNMRISMKVKGEPSEQKSKIQLDDFNMIAQYYSKSANVKDKLFSFALVLLFNTGERNASVREVPFSYFIHDKDGSYSVRIDASKTDSSQKHKITQEQYLFIQKVQKTRATIFSKKLKTYQKCQKKLRQFKKELQQLEIESKQQFNSQQIGSNNVILARQINLQQLLTNQEITLQSERRIFKLAKRRQKYVFPFYTGSAFNTRFKKMKEKFKGVTGINNFVIHCIRGMKLQSAFEGTNIKEAQKIANHKSHHTTAKYYLDLSKSNLSFNQCTNI